MSRNKIIKMVHDYTGLSYKQCRSLCKYHHWNKDKLTVVALTYDADTLGSLKESCDNVYSAFFDVGAKIAETMAAFFDHCAEAFRNQTLKYRVQSKRMQALMAAPSEVQPPLTAHVGNVSFPIELEPSELKPLSIEEMREQFGLNPFSDVNDPHTPVFAPYYASTGINEKLYGSERGRNTSETWV